MRFFHVIEVFKLMTWFFLEMFLLMTNAFYSFLKFLANILNGYERLSGVFWWQISERLSTFALVSPIALFRLQWCWQLNVGDNLWALVTKFGSWWYRLDMLVTHFVSDIRHQRQRSFFSIICLKYRIINQVKAVKCTWNPEYFTN